MMTFGEAIKKYGVGSVDDITVVRRRNGERSWRCEQMFDGSVGATRNYLRLLLGDDYENIPVMVYENMNGAGEHVVDAYISDDMLTVTISAEVAGAFDMADVTASRARDSEESKQLIAQRMMAYETPHAQ